MITAQILSIIGLALSWFGIWWVSIFLALPAMIMLQVTWCCAMNKCGLIASGVLATVAAGWVLVVAILLIVALEAAKSDCDDYSYYYDSDSCIANSGYSAYTAYIILSVLGGVIWLVTGIIVFVFACGQRYTTALEKLKEENGEPAQADPETPTETKAVAVEPAPAPAASTTSTTTITNLPDGSVEKKTEVVNPDGSKTVTVTVERPE